MVNLLKLFKPFAFIAMCMVATTSFANNFVNSLSPQSVVNQPVSSQSNWRYINVANNEFKLWVDSNSVHTVQTFFGKQYKQAWFKREITNDINQLDNVHIGDYYLDLWRANCDTFQITGVKTLQYTKTNIFIAQYHVPVYMRNVIPATAGQAIFNSMCS